MPGLVRSPADEKALFPKTCQKPLGLSCGDRIGFGNPHRRQGAVKPQQLQKIALAGRKSYTDIYTDILAFFPLDLERLQNASQHEISMSNLSTAADISAMRFTASSLTLYGGTYFSLDFIALWISPFATSVEE